jgi:hypothetical protein
MKLILKRQFENNNQTLGQLSVINNNNVEVFVCKTLELPFRGNKRRISAIPYGNYNICKRISPKYGLHLWVLDVPNRDFILIHQGNFFTDILGCILVGNKLDNIGKNSDLDILNSRATLDIILSYLGTESTLTIVNDINFINVKL